MKTCLERFNEKHEPAPETGCWLWAAARHRQGYGLFRFDGVVGLAHRASWVLNVGPIPQGLAVLHHCDTPACVNHAHLFLGTQKDNIADMDRKGRRRSIGSVVRGIGNGTGENNTRAKVSDEDVRAIRASTGNGVVVGAQYGISKTTVSRIRLRKRWAHVA